MLQGSIGQTADLRAVCLKRRVSIGPVAACSGLPFGDKSLNTWRHKGAALVTRATRKHIFCQHGGSPRHPDFTPRRGPRSRVGVFAAEFPTDALRRHFALRSLHFKLNKHDLDIFNLAIPALFSTLLDPVMGLVDTALLGRLGASQLAASGLGNLMFGIFMICFNFLLFATTPLVAGAVARGDWAEASKASTAGLWLAVVAGSIAGIVLWFGAPLLLTRLGAQPEVLVHAIPYLRYRALACPVVLSLFIAFATFRGYKDTRAPLIASVLANAANFVLDLVLMFGLGLGAGGAALATTVSQYISCFVLFYMLVKRDMLRVSDVVRPPSLPHLMPLLKAAVGLMARSLTGAGTFVGLNVLVASRGPIALAAHEIAKQGWIISSQAFGAVDIAAQSLVAGHLGVGDRESALEALTRALMWGVGLAGAAATALIIGRHHLPYLFVKDAAVATKAAQLLPVIGFFLPLDAAARMLDGGLLGARDTKWVSTTSVTVSMLVALGLLAGQRLGLGVVGLWLSFKLSSIGTIAAAAVRYNMREGPFGRKQLALDETPMVVFDRQGVPDPRISLSGGSFGSTHDNDQ